MVVGHRCITAWFERNGGVSIIYTKKVTLDFNSQISLKYRHSLGVICRIPSGSITRWAYFTSYNMPTLTKKLTKNFDRLLQSIKFED